jgi:hypothetical protein
MIQRLINRNDINGAKIFLEEILKGNISFQPKDILLCLKSGYPEIEFLAFKIVKNFSYKFKKEQLKKAFEFNEKELNSFLVNSAVCFQFPIVNEKGGELANGIVVEIDSQRIISNKNIISFPFLKKGCVVYFDSDFEGNSFQAPLFIALHLKRYPNKLLFTGTIRNNGEIFANMIKEKENIAKKLGRILISKGNIVKLTDILKKDKLDIPVLISTDKNTTDLEKLSSVINTDLDIITQLSSLSKNELMISLPKQLSLKDNWNNYILSTIEHFKKIRSSIEPYISILPFHIALKIPSSLAIGIGASIGTGKIPIILYHYDPLKGYINLINLAENSRTIKKKIDKFEELSIIKRYSGKNEDRCIIGIRLASHSLEGRAFQRLITQLNGDVFLIEHKKFTGNLPINTDWTRIVAELRGIIEEIHRDYSEIHIVMSIPVIIAFALGMALGHYWNIHIYQFNREDDRYYQVLNLKHIPVM